MLTVRYHHTDGTDEIFEVLSLKYDNRDSAPTAAHCKPTSGRVEFIRPHAKDDTMAFAYSGLVYVMNETGKTVAKYDLGGWPITLGDFDKKYVGEQRINSIGASPIGGQIV